MNINPVYLNASQEAGKAFYLSDIEGSFMMLNLLKFKAMADYSAHKALAPDTPISGKEAYKRYMAHTLPFLKEAGGEVVIHGKSGAFLIGPQDEEWDAILIVKHASKMAFLQFAQNEAYLTGAGHRDAALADSRLLPFVSP
ncbi:MAG: DUF1330 domain-containing protein [Bacteroidia bacterium]